MLELFETPLTVLHIFVCLFLILVVLIQPGKSGGLGAALGGAGAQQVFGGRGAGNFLSRATWICASTFFVTSMVLAYISSSADDSLEDREASSESTKSTPPGKDEAALTPAAASGASATPDPEQGVVGQEPAAVEVPAASGQSSAEAVSPEPQTTAAAPVASLTVPSLGGLKPGLLSTVAPIAPKPPALPIAPVKPPPVANGSVPTAPAVVAAPATPVSPAPAVSAGLPRKSVPPTLPLKPAAPAASN